MPRKPMPHVPRPTGTKASRATAKLQPFYLTSGTRNGQGPAHRYTTVTLARNAAIKIVRDIEPWCLRHNQAGLKPLRELVGQLELVNDLFEEPKVFEAVYDEWSGMHITIKLWKGKGT